MIYNFLKNTFLFLAILIISCGRSSGQIEEPVKGNNENISSAHSSKDKRENIMVGANRLEEYLPLLQNKNVGIVANQSTVVFKNQENQYAHLVDTLIARDVQIRKVFAPEHGFRGTADAGEIIIDGKDSKTGLPIISLYGNNKKPSKEQLAGIDVMIFDLQDVGARFYTYISSLHYVMEACAENNIPLIILDRPNPNGHYVDGPILDVEYKSFVGMHPVPVVHGLTIAEYAQMINGEKWLNNEVTTKLHIIAMQNYTHDKSYILPIKPSPNLPNAQAINLYPSLCFFEGTNVNAGRGTNKQFQVFGSPFLDKNVFSFSYTPQSMDGAKSPKHLGVKCFGSDLSKNPKLNEINLDWLIQAYNNTQDKSEFFNSFFSKLAGGKELQHQIESGMSPAEIKATWQEGLEKYKELRKHYLLYK